MIRRFKEEDFEQLLNLGYEMNQESTFKDLGYSRDKIYNLMMTCIDKPDIYIGLADENNGVIDGMFVGYVSEYLFSEKLIASELILYVRKSKRGGTAGLRMVREFESWAKEKNVSEIMLDVCTGINQQRTVDFYKRLGYKESGIIVKK